MTDLSRARRDTRTTRTRRRWVVWSIVVAAVVLIGAGLAVYGTSMYRDAMSVKKDLETAKAQLAKLQTAADEKRFADLAPIAADFSAAAERAVEPTRQAGWGAAEAVPVLGENFRAVRVIAEGINEISDAVVTPAATLVADIKLAKDPTTGGFDLTPVREATRIAAEADRIVTRLTADVDGIDTGSTVAQVSEAVDELKPMLATASQAVPALHGALVSVGSLLGIEGPQTVALVFLNNAETAALGGGPAAQTILSVDNGAVSMAGQLSSQNFPRGIPLGIDVDESANVLYDDILTQNINGATSRPDFPTAAKILTAQIQRAAGITPDTIVSIDPIALSKMLAVTGPVTLADGTVLSAENVVSVLLNEAYFLYPDGEDSDAFFAAAASAVFDRVMSADYDLWAMADAVSSAANNGDLMLWSANPDTQKLLDGLAIQGTLPTANEPDTVLGVYFRDRSASKIDYYLRTATTVTTNTCTPDSPSYTVETHLRFEIPEDLELPDYVDANLFDFYRTEVFLYGPVGGTIAGAETPVVGVESVVGPGVTDLNRPAQKFVVDLLNGQDAVVKATFAGTPEAGPYGPTVVRTTPMINPTTVTMAEASCG